MLTASLPSHLEISIRPERPADAAAVRRVLETAFQGPLEADLVEALRASGSVTLALVAEYAGDVVGHILFSPVRVAAEQGETPALGLGPLAVRLQEQNLGVGSALVRTALNILRSGPTPLVFVLGHPAYYGRFGFKPAAAYGIGCQFDVPEEAFMVLELRPGALEGVRGTVWYAPEFGGLA